MLIGYETVKRQSKNINNEILGKITFQSAGFFSTKKDLVFVA
jgi:hypothetical protein